MALKDGAEFVGESFIFMVSVSLLLWEYNRSAQSTQEKQEKKRQEIKAQQAVLQAKLHTLDIRLKAVEDAVKEQTDTLLGIATIKKKGVYKEPPPQELVPIDDDHSEEGQSDQSKEKDESSTTTASLSDSTSSKPRWKFW